MKFLMGTCRQVSQILSAAMDRRLTLKERIRLRLHFRVCTWCHDHKKQLDALSHGGRRLGALCEDPRCSVSLAPEARQRIKDALKKKQ